MSEDDFSFPEDGLSNDLVDDIIISSSDDEVHYEKKEKVVPLVSTDDDSITLGDTDEEDSKDINISKKLNVISKSNNGLKVEETKKELSTVISKYEVIDGVHVPQSLLKKRKDLFKYQWEGISWIYRLYISKSRGCILADEMGLGKTIQVTFFLNLIAKMKDNFRCLIIVPFTLIPNWNNEFKNWLGYYECRINVYEHQGTVKKRRENLYNAVREKRIVVLSSYDTVLSDIDILNGSDYIIDPTEGDDPYRDRRRISKWDVIVLDEASVIKNPQAKKTKACHSLPGDFRIAISGTPLQNNLTELWSLIKFALPDITNSHSDLATFGAFKTNYSTIIERVQLKDSREQSRDGGNTYLAEKAKKQLQQLIGGRILRREKLGVNGENSKSGTESVIKPGMKLSSVVDKDINGAPIITCMKCFRRIVGIDVASLDSVIEEGSSQLISCDCGAVYTMKDLVTFCELNRMMAEHKSVDSNIETDGPYIIKKMSVLTPTIPTMSIDIPNSMSKSKFELDTKTDAKGNIIDFEYGNNGLTNGKRQGPLDFTVWLRLKPIQRTLYGSLVTSDEFMTKVEVVMDNSISALSLVTLLRKVSDDPHRIKEKDVETMFASNGRAIVEEARKLPSIKASAKIEFLCKLCTHFVDEATKGSGILTTNIIPTRHALIFSSSSLMLEIAKNAVERLPCAESIRCFKLDGTITKTSERQNIIDSFSLSPFPLSLLFITIGVGGVGLNITAASTVILLEPSWNPANEAQAIGRCDRIGQQHRVVVIRLVTEETIEEKIIGKLCYKRSIFASALGGSEQTQKVKPSDIKCLLKDINFGCGDDGSLATDKPFLKFPLPPESETDTTTMEICRFLQRLGADKVSLQYLKNKPHLVVSEIPTPKRTPMPSAPQSEAPTPSARRGRGQPIRDKLNLSEKEAYDSLFNNEWAGESVESVEEEKIEEDPGPINVEEEDIDEMYEKALSTETAFERMARQADRVTREVVKRLANISVENIKKCYCYIVDFNTKQDSDTKLDTDDEMFIAHMMARGVGSQRQNLFKYFLAKRLKRECEEERIYQALVVLQALKLSELELGGGGKK